MSAILPLHALVVDEAHVGFIDQGGGLQTVTRALAPHVASGEAPEFVIDDGGQPVERGSISIAPGSEQAAHFRIFGSARPFLRRRLKVSHAHTPGNHTLPGQSLKDKERSTGDSFAPRIAPI